MKKQWTAWLLAAVLVFLCAVCSADSLTEEDLRLLTVRVNGETYIIGQSTPQDLIDHDWYPMDGPEGLIDLSDAEGYGDIYLCTENNRMDEPILSFDAFWAYEAVVEYCGFDGIISSLTEDPDNLWLPEPFTQEEWDEFVSDDWNENKGLWDALINWMVTELGAEADEHGIYSVNVTLSDGRTLIISTHYSPVGLMLVSGTSAED